MGFRFAWLSMLSLVILSVGLRTASAASCPYGNLDLSLIMNGVPASEYIPRLRQICDFIESADRKLKAIHPGKNLNVLGGGQLLTLKEEAVEIVLVVGGSADFLPEEAGRVNSLTSEYLSFLRRFNPAKTIFVGGGTDSGAIGLFHELATKQGFPMLGMMPISGTAYGAGAMTHLYLDMGLAFGSESHTAVSLASSIVMFGGGNQSVREVIQGALGGKPIYIVENERFGGASAQTAEALARFRNVKVFKSSSLVADEMVHRTSGILSRLPQGGIDSTISEFHSVYSKRDFYKLGFSTWSRNAPSAAGEKKFKEFARALLTELKAKGLEKKVLIVLAGTMPGGEGFVIELATALGFTVIGTPAASVQTSDISPLINQFIETGTTWETRNRHFIMTLDGLVTAGESSTLLSQIESAHHSQLDLFNVEGVSAVIDMFVGRLKNGRNYSREAANEIANVLRGRLCQGTVE